MNNWDEELRFISGLLQPDWNVVQAGANTGVFPLAFAKQVKHVICAEPQRPTFDALVTNILRADATNVRALWGAFGIERGEILCPRVDVGRTDVGLRCAPGDGYLVPLMPIDDVVEDIPIHFIQLDVEGMEIEALVGAERTIRRSRPILYIEANASIETLVSLCANFNYTRSEAPNNNVVLTPCPA